MEKHEFKIEVKELSREVLFEKDAVTIKVEFFWDSHGKMFPFDGGPKHKKTFSKKTAAVKIEKVTFKYNDIAHTFESWNLYVDGVRFEAEVSKFHYDGFSTIKVKAVVGAG